VRRRPWITAGPRPLGVHAGNAGQRPNARWTHGTATPPEGQALYRSLSEYVAVPRVRLLSQFNPGDIETTVRTLQAIAERAAAEAPSAGAGAPSAGAGIVAS
jgi:hypothetical protein